MKLISLFLIFFSLTANGGHDHGSGGNSFEGSTSGGQMFNLPIHVMMSMQGPMVHYGIGTNMHGGGHMGNMGNMGNMDGHMGEGHGRKVCLMIMPMVHMGGDVHKRVINLTENNLDHLSKGKGDDLRLLELDENSSQGFLLIENKRIEVGAGLMVMGAPKSINWGLWASAGVMPYVGGSSFHQRFVKDRETLENIKKMKVPETISELETWSMQDKMSYTVHGGVMFSAGAGITIFFDTGLMYMAQGMWKVSLEKVDHNKIRVRIRKEKLHHLAFSTTTVISSLNVGGFRSSDKSFGYIFDLRDASARKAYKHMLWGDISLAQKFVKEGLSKGLTHETQGFSKSKGRMFNLSAGIPFLGQASLGKGVMKSYSEEVNFVDGMTMNNHMGMYYDERKTSGVISHHKKKTFNFMAMHMTMKKEFEEEGVTKFHEVKSHHGSFQWLFERDHGKVKHLRRAFSKLANRTGLLPDFNPDLPDDQKLGYVRTSFSVNISERGMNKLMKKDYDFKGTSRTLINKWFKNRTNPAKICKVYKTIKNCKAAMVKRTTYAVTKMKMHLLKMDKFLENKNYTKFTESYTKFGKQFLKNIFTFNTILSLAGERNVKIDFELMGEKLLKTKMSLKPSLI